MKEWINKYILDVLIVIILFNVLMLVLGMLSGIKYENIGDVFGYMFLSGLMVQFILAFLVFLCLVTGIIQEKRKYRWSSTFVILNIILAGTFYFIAATHC